MVLAVSSQDLKSVVQGLTVHDSAQPERDFLPAEGKSASRLHKFRAQLLKAGKKLTEIAEKVDRAAGPAFLAAGAVWATTAAVTTFEKLRSGPAISVLNSRVVVGLILPVSLILLGSHIADAVKILKNPPVKELAGRIFEVSAKIIQDIGDIIGTVATSLDALQSLKVVANLSAVGITACYAVSGFFSSLSIVVTARKLHKRIKFQKEMKESIQDGKFAEFIAQHDVKEIERAFDVKDGEKIKKIVADAFREGADVENQKDLMDKLSKRVTHSNWSDGLSLLIDTVNVAATVMLMCFPPLAIAGFALSASMGVVSLGKMGYEHYATKHFMKSLE